LRGYGVDRRTKTKDASQIGITKPEKVIIRECSSFG
jgi:hypothetical protein